MGRLNRFRYRLFSQSEPVNELVTEIVRKSIHIAASCIIVPAAYWYYPTLAGIICLTGIYCISELLRMHNIEAGLIGQITRHAARKRDRNRFVLGPVTLAAGIFFALLLFPLHSAKIAIFALAFGDGFASLVGKRFGKRKLHIAKDKTVAGSMACFTAVLVTTYLVSFSLQKSCIIAGAAACIEMLPLKDYDNLLIPLAIGYLAVVIGA